MNNAQYVSFESSVDLDQAPAEGAFTNTWRVRNNGTTTWGVGYKVVHIHANAGSTLMAAQASFDLAHVASAPTVAPGQEVTISLAMKAPAAVARRFFSDWQLQDAQGNLFGDVIWYRMVTTKKVVTSGNFRRSDCKFIEDHSIPDNTPIRAGTSFRKQWVVKNTGKRKWSNGYRLVYVSGSTELTGKFSHPVPEASPGDEVVISVDMVSPLPRADAYSSAWRIHDDRNIPFGDILWIKMFATGTPGTTGPVPYSQNDSKWKHKKLGFGPRTIGEFGCLLSCYAMMLRYVGEDTDPSRLNDIVLGLPQGKGFDGSNVFFLAPTVVYSHVHFLGNYKPYANTGATFAQFDPNLIERIDRALVERQGVVAQVDFNPNTPYNQGTEQHWIWIIARQGDDYVALDPLEGRYISVLSKYGRQTRPQDAKKALKDAIKSALFYSSARIHDVPPLDLKEAGFSPKAGSALGPSERPSGYTGRAWPFNKMLIGVHDRANRHPLQPDYSITRGKFESVKVQSGVSVAEMQKYGAKFYMCRLFESWNGRHLPVDDFIRAVVPDMKRLVDAGVEYFELHNEPNLTHEGLHAHGVQGSWSNGAEFAQYFIEARQKLKQKFPNIKVGFPGLSPGGDQAYAFGHDKGFRMNHRTFLEGAQVGIEAADFLCVHAYYVTMQEVKDVAVAEVQWYRSKWPDKLLFITEFSNPDPGKNISAVDKGKQAKAFYRLCREIPGVAAAYYFIVSGSGWDHQALRRDGDGRSTGIIEHMF